MVALTDDESTLKAESRLKTPVSLVKISDACAQKIGKASTTFTETGFHQVNELKKILLNANFAEQISLKANGINGCESGTKEDFILLIISINLLQHYHLYLTTVTVK